MKNSNFLPVTIIIISYNVERTLPEVLKSISVQDYPKKLIEVLLIDGQSTDNTLDIAKKSPIPVKIIQSSYPKDPEACRAIGIEAARHNIIAFIDADNYMPHDKWLRKMIMPFIKHIEIYGVQTLRYGYRKKDSALNRYFALLGAADPVAFYLSKADRLSYLYDEWNLFGTIKKRFKNYFIITFFPQKFPTLGCNGFLFRKDILLDNIRITPRNFFHIDTPLDLAKKGITTYAIVDDVIIHDTAGTFLTFLKKRARYMKLHYLIRSSNRRYRVFNPQNKEDIVNLTKFVVLSLTFIEPFIFSLRGYFKRKDVVWFIHPFFCFSICLTYGYMVVMGFFQLRLAKYNRP